MPSAWLRREGNVYERAKGKVRQHSRVKGRLSCSERPGTPPRRRSRCARFARIGICFTGSLVGVSNYLNDQDSEVETDTG